MDLHAFDHVHIYASAPDRTIAFFTSMFGAEPIGSTSNVDGDVNHLLLIGAQLLVVSAVPRSIARAAPVPDDVPAGHRLGLAHVGFNVASVDAGLAELTRAGVRVLEPARQSGLIRYAYVEGPDGVAIELTEYVLPLRLKLLAPLLAGYNRAAHAVRRRILKAGLSKR